MDRLDRVEAILEETSKDRKKMQKEMQEERKRDRKEMQEERKRDRKEMQEERKRDREEMQEERKRDREERKKEKEERKKDREETERLIKAIGTDLGGVTRNMSRETEQFFARGIKKNGLRIGPYQFDDIKTNEKYQHPERGEVEIDIYLPNSTVSGIGEVKNVLRAKDVRNHRDKRIPKFIDIYPEYRHKKIIGIVAGKVIHEDAVKLAHSYGFVILAPEGQDLKIDASAIKALKL